MINCFKDDNNLVSSIEALIEVTPPYFALENIYVNDNGWLVTKIPVQCHSLYEKTLMDASEVGRHLAILGSCYGALINPDKIKHYYLAHEAELITYEYYVSNSRPEYLYARAKAEFVNKRKLVAKTELVDGFERVCAHLIVKYHVFKEKSFSRVYGNVTKEPLDCFEDANPYSESVSLDVIYIDSNSLVAEVGEILPNMCLGHFENVKALPVAILSQCFLNSSCMLLRSVLGSKTARFVLKKCKLKADKLAVSGQSVTVYVQCIENIANSFITKCTAKNQLGEVVGEMECCIDQV